MEPMWKREKGQKHKVKAKSESKSKCALVVHLDHMEVPPLAENPPWKAYDIPVVASFNLPSRM